MWLYVPNTAGSTSSPSAREGADSISESSWLFPALEACVWWRGKPSPSRTWWTRWSKVFWLRRLCGRMPEPFAAGHGAAAWTASLAASRASLIRSPDCDAGLKTNATSGRPRAALSSKPARGSCSSRTSPGCSPAAAANGFGETWADLVSRARSDCSRRQKSARRTNGSAFSSSAWPTPQSRDFKGVDRTDIDRGNVRPLNEIVAHWATPRASEAGSGLRQTGTEFDRNSAPGAGGSLVDAARQRRGEGRAEPELRRGRDSSAEHGGGVVSLEAAYALRTLATRLAAGGSAAAALLVRMMGAA